MLLPVSYLISYYQKPQMTNKKNFKTRKSRSSTLNVGKARFF
ncbi:hypothetical protein HMPREF3187_00147 [Aerococcus christensenii]|uniref:Uncharacterized protein n=1 Tax=Aerococcus christensenii TaxID=87541 RepID=A0A133Y4F5_9LACT|nr:hypothetical protein HMPREF3187_00147 [Aerococcus christensenii]